MGIEAENAVSCCGSALTSVFLGLRLSATPLAFLCFIPNIICILRCAMAAVVVGPDTCQQVTEQAIPM